MPGVDSKHPLYAEFVPDWIMMRDTYRGERVVKDKGTEYLPATAGMLLDGMALEQEGYKAYLAYKQRAVFHDFVSEAVEHYIGLLHTKPPTIELPPQLEPMREKATLNGESLEHLLRRINEQQLVTGRLGILLDLPTNPDPAHPLPYIATYQAEDVINWDDGGRTSLTVPRLNLVVLNESGWERTDQFTWEQMTRYRVLALGDLLDNEGLADSAVYKVGVFDDKHATFSEGLMVEPSIRGTTLNDIPFVFVNSKDCVSTPDDPPLLGLARLALAVYRGEADYRQSLFLQSQDTLVVIGAVEDNFRVGAGATIALPAIQGADAKFIGVDSQGLSEQRQALENDKVAAGNKAGQLTDSRSKTKESGEALSIRLAAQTATLNQLALAGAQGLERLLKLAAVWVGANPDEVIVTPNLEFADREMSGEELTQYMSAKAMGAPWSLESIHRMMQERGLTQMEFEEELAKIGDEAPLVPAEEEGTDAGGDPDEDEEAQGDPDPNAGLDDE